MTVTYGNVKAFTPTEAAGASVTRIPDVVIEAVNAVLAKYAANRRSFSIPKREIVEEITSRDPELTEDVLLANHWLDFEQVYREQGWKCHYESPDWGSSGGGYFEFQAKLVVPQPAR
jgi:hypothetical protein